MIETWNSTVGFQFVTNGILTPQSGDRKNGNNPPVDLPTGDSVNQSFEENKKAQLYCAESAPGSRYADTTPHMIPLAYIFYVRGWSYTLKP